MTDQAETDDHPERERSASACSGELGGAASTYTLVEHPGDWARAAAREHFGEIPDGAEVCYCGDCDGFFVADPYPSECWGGCGGHGCRVDSFAYYYAYDSARLVGSAA